MAYKPKPQKFYDEMHERQAWKRDYKLERGCTDCGYNECYAALQFDHVPERGPKLFNVANSNHRSWENLRAEVAKCDVVCANCHAVRTMRRRNAVA